jgi:phage tail-like protein
MNQLFHGPRGRRLGYLCLVLAGAALVAPTVRGANAGPATSAGFRVEIDGAAVDGLKTVSGLESEVEVVEYRNGDDPITHKRPGAVKYKNIVLKRGLSKSDKLAQWFDEIRKGSTERKSGSVIYLDRAGAEVLRYNFFEAWPCRWSAPELDADVKDVQLLETISICVERVDRLVR